MATQPKKIEQKNSERQGGRPIEEEVEKKTFPAKTLLTQSEHSQLQADYEAFSFGRKISFSAYLRHLILQRTSNKGATGFQNQETSLELLFFCNDWKEQIEGLSMNYNQVVKRINSLPCSTKLANEMEKGSEILQEAGKGLQKIDHLKKQIERWLSGLPMEKM